MEYILAFLLLGSAAFVQDRARSEQSLKQALTGAHDNLSEFSLAQIRRTGAKASWRQPWTVD
jgi:hypothetical protein